MDKHVDDNNQPKQDGTESTLRALSLLKKDFGNYFQKFEEQFGEMACPLCKKTVWGIPPRADDNNYPAIVTLPLPNTGGRGIWAYPVVCVECGFVATFAAYHIVNKIKEG